jgi:hypothetical protein
VDESDVGRDEQIPFRELIFVDFFNTRSTDLLIA